MILPPHASNPVVGFCCTGRRHKSVLTSGITMYQVAESSVISMNFCKGSLNSLERGRRVYFFAISARNASA
jgi:phage regulator Rha-like protein